MKSVEEVTACVVDYGSFLWMAEALAETMSKVYYYSPIETEFQDIRNCLKGTGLDRVERQDNFLDPDILDTIDLFVFPDIGYGTLQRHLRSVGKAVWGHMGADEIELNRDLFLEVLKEVDLPILPSKRIVGLTALAAYLEDHDDKWIKINRYRAHMETWHHLDYQHSIRTLDSMAVIFGGAKESVVFVVQDNIEADIEIGYDGWCIDGNYPGASFQGYEKKNELYLGSVLTDRDLPDELKRINEAMAPLLRDYVYRNWWATEVRVADGVPYFIDPTPRMAQQTTEHQPKSIRNFADIVWQGANGIVIPPKFKYTVAAEATLHYKRNVRDRTITDEWMTLNLTPEQLEWVALYHYCVIDGVHHFMVRNNDEIGVVMGVGDTVEEATGHLMENLELLKGLPIDAETSGFASLFESIQEAMKQGMHFGSPIPSIESIESIMGE